MVAGPPPDVIAAFGLTGDGMVLVGGEGKSVRVGDSVLKPVHDEREAAWTQDLLARIEEEGFRVAAPRRAEHGGWVFGGWTASAFIDGLRPGAPDWDLITAAGMRFADAGERARRGGEEVLALRTHRWARADRAAWGEEQVRLGAAATGILDAITELLADQNRPSARQLVHGDLTGNVFVDPSGVPVVLDVSPYIRPRRWAAAIVMADAVLWLGAELSVAKSFAVSDPAARDLLGRALAFRVVAEQLEATPRHGAMLEPYRRVLAALSQLET